ncbi:MAG: hypothetical protein JWQ14_1826 [Adhaeribacter sp.]|nr:hypothetical protein [Adhaeribacter sp.]
MRERRPVFESAGTFGFACVLAFYANFGYPSFPYIR